MNVLITGGAGFIVSNISKYYLDHRDQVLILDNFSRKSSYNNTVWLENIFNKKINVLFRKQRVGDQSIYISDIRRAKSEFNWEPKISNEESIQDLYKWVIENNNYFKKMSNNLASNFN